MQNKISLRIIQVGLLLVMVAVVVFGRKSPHREQLVPGAIPGGDGSAGLQLRRAPLPPTSSRPLLPVRPPQSAHARPTASVLPAATSLARELPPDLRVRRHRIVEGDSIERLAEQYLGDAARYAEIYQANSRLLAQPDVLPLGEYLIIPPRAAGTKNVRRTVQDLRQVTPTMDASSRPLLPVP